MKEKTKLIKKTRMVAGDSLMRDLKGGVIEEIGKDWDNNLVVLALADGRVLAISGTGVMVFVNREAYLLHADEVITEVRKEESKLIN